MNEFIAQFRPSGYDNGVIFCVNLPKFMIPLYHFLSVWSNLINLSVVTSRNRLVFYVNSRVPKPAKVPDKATLTWKKISFIALLIHSTYCYSVHQLSDYLLSGPTVCGSAKGELVQRGRGYGRRWRSVSDITRHVRFDYLYWGTECYSQCALIRSGASDVAHHSYWYVN